MTGKLTQFIIGLCIGTVTREVKIQIQIQISYFDKEQ